jgi:aspartyl protease family protein
MRSALIPGYAVATEPGVLVLSESADGHFHVFGEVNGARVSFLIDTGASDIVLSPADARRAGIDIEALNFDRIYQTANGLGRGATATLDTLSIGPIALSDVRVSVNQAEMRQSLLGMTFLKRLAAFRIEGNRLYLHWR